jgi:hypothetical protein
VQLVLKAPVVLKVVLVQLARKVAEVQLDLLVQPVQKVQQALKVAAALKVAVVQLARKVAVVQSV